VSFAPLSDTWARLGVSSSTPAVLMKITAGRTVDMLRIFILGVDSEQSAMRAPQLEWCYVPVQGGRSVEPGNATYDAGRDWVEYHRTQRGEGAW
jgi:hypothetical protein